MVEYGACGVPVISARRDEALDYLAEGSEAFYYDNARDLVEQVKPLVKDPGKLREVGAAARLRCEKEHDIRHRVDELLPFLETVMSSR